MVQQAAQVPGTGRIDTDIVSILEAHGADTLRYYAMGSALYWEGEPADCAFVVVAGHVKTYCMSTQGKVHAYAILGAGDLLGAAELLLHESRISTAQALTNVQAYLIPEREFTRLLTADPQFNSAVVLALADTIRSRDQKIRSLGLMDVEDRLKYSLTALASEYGTQTDRGTEIDLNITHQGLAELIAASRPTVTEYLGALRRRGYVRIEGHRLVLTAPSHMDILDHLSAAVTGYDEQQSIRWAQKAIAEGVDPVRALDALVSGMKQVDSGLRRGELALPDVILAALAMQSGRNILVEALNSIGRQQDTLGKVVIGTPEGDIHDIGKTMVSAILIAHGYEVIDLGVDVPARRFVQAVVDHGADILAISALLTSTVREECLLIETLAERGIRDKVKVMVGGGAMTAKLAANIGADGFVPNAHDTPNLARYLMGLGEPEGYGLWVSSR